MYDIGRCGARGPVVRPWCSPSRDGKGALTAFSQVRTPFSDVSEGGLEPAQPPPSRPVSGLPSADPSRFGLFHNHRCARCATWGRTDC